MFSDFLIPAVAVGLAELGDKTQLAVILLAAKTDRHWRLFLGVMSGFLLVDGLAVAAGALSGGLLPLRLVQALSGSIFILFGILGLRDGGSEDAGRTASARGPFSSGFIMVAASEMGDKTQIVAGLFAAEYEPLLVLFGALSALAATSCLAIYFGRRLSKRLERRMLSQIAGLTFILIGGVTLGSSGLF